jgi:MSHA type pilus biogenesis protein MshL
MKIQYKKMGLIRRVTLLSSCILLLSCAEFNKGRDAERLKDIIDPTLGMTREQFKNGLNGSTDKAKKEINSEPKIPEASEILAAPPAPEALPDKLISLSVTEDVPLKDVLMELSRLAEVDMEIDPGITGGIIFRVKDRPFKEVLERVVALSGLRYTSKNGVMRVERDLPYQSNYKVDFLNITRSNDSTTSVDTKGLSSGDSTSSSTATGTSSTITNKSTDDVWESVEKAIKNMLNFTATNNSTSASSGSSTTATGSTSDSALQINKPAGVMSIIATEAQHKSIKAYLDKVKEQVSAQVLIEAKIVEVTLDDEYKSGIDWGTLADKNLGIKISGNFKGGISSTADFLTLSAGGDKSRNLTSAVSLTEKFGVSRTLSSPRVNAINNQEAVLTFVKNEVYYKLDVTEQTDGTGATATTSAKVSSTLKTAPIGVILSIQPSINLETQEITMHVRPTLSVKTGTVRDPAVDITVAKINQTATTQQTIDSSIPEIETKSLDSILKIRSGEVMVIGGLMKNTATSEDNGVPFVNRAPIFGNLFKSKVQANNVVETVIFIKATIVPTGGVPSADKKTYQTYMKDDPHPLAF